jgi:hypothetical protein
MSPLLRRTLRMRLLRPMTRRVVHYVVRRRPRTQIAYATSCEVKVQSRRRLGHEGEAVGPEKESFLAAKEASRRPGAASA